MAGVSWLWFWVSHVLAAFGGLTFTFVAVTFAWMYKSGKLGGGRMMLDFAPCADGDAMKIRFIHKVGSVWKQRIGGGRIKLMQSVGIFKKDEFKTGEGEVVPIPGDYYLHGRAGIQRVIGIYIADYVAEINRLQNRLAELQHAFANEVHDRDTAVRMIADVANEFKNAINMGGGGKK